MEILRKITWQLLLTAGMLCVAAAASAAEDIYPATKRNRMAFRPDH